MRDYDGIVLSQSVPSQPEIVPLSEHKGQSTRSRRYSDRGKPGSLQGSGADVAAVDTEHWWLGACSREAGDPSDNGAEVKREIKRGLRKVRQGAILVQEVAHVGYQHAGEPPSAQVA